MHTYGRNTARHRSAIMVCLLMAGASGPALAEQTAGSSPVLSIELNNAEPQEDACRLTFVARNEMGTDLDTAVFETVLFSTDGAVLKLTLFDFQALPADRPRVRQFDVPGAQCEAIAQVLINGVHKCTGSGIANTDCAKALRPQSRTQIEVVG